MEYDEMLKSLVPEKSIIHIAGREYQIRYSLNTLLCLEMEYKPLREIISQPFTSWEPEDIIQLARAAMCSLPENAEAVSRRDFDAVKPGIYELGELIRPEDLPLLSMELIDAIITSLPEPDGKTVQTDPEQDEDDGALHAMCVDVIGMPEVEFWDSSKRDLALRIDKWRQVKGLDIDPEKEPEPEVKMFDDRF